MPSQPSQPEQHSSRPRALTLAVASASSVVAALVVSKIWGPGTLIGAAATPVIVTLVGELLKKPAEKITVIRVSPTGTEVHERTAPPPLGQGGMAERSMHRSGRRPLAIALATGLLAFVIGAIVLTSSELVFGDSSVGSGAKRTTVFGGGTKRRPPRDKPSTPASPTTTTTETRTETTTAPTPTTPTTPTPEQTTPTQTAPPSQTAPPTAPEAAPAPETGTTSP